MTTSRHPASAQATIGRRTLSNRMAVAPMTRVSATRTGVPTAQMADYYARYARGGFGLIITEGTYTDAVYSQGYTNQPGLLTPDQTAGWQRVTSSVHAAESLVIAQLMHAGALSQGNEHSTATAGPSAVTPRGEKMSDYGGSGLWPTPQAMSSDDIATAISGFVAAARNAVAAGFDGVELHGANGYLLDQFLTEYTNLRDDEYGGGVDAGIRLTTEVAAAVRQAVPADFLLGVRLSQTKVNDFSYRWPGGAADAEAIFTALTETGVDYLHVASEGVDWIETARLDSGETITALARKVSGLPVIANGGMHDLEQAAAVLSAAHADVLSFGRGALANPDLPRRLADGAPLAAFDPGILHPLATLDNAERRQVENGR